MKHLLVNEHMPKSKDDDYLAVYFTIFFNFRDIRLSKKSLRMLTEKKLQDAKDDIYKHFKL